MTTENENEKTQEPPQVIFINTKEHVKKLIEAGELAGKTTAYNRRKSDTLIFFNDGENQTINPLLAEYLYRAERAAVKDMMENIIQEAGEMIGEELTHIKELLG